MTEQETKLYLMLRRLVNVCQHLDEGSGYVPCEPDAMVLGEALAMVAEIQDQDEARAARRTYAK